MTEAPEHIPLWRESRFSSREMRSHEGPSRSNPLGRWAVEDTQPTEAGDSWLQSAWRSATNPQGRRMSTHGQGHGPVSKRTQNKAVPAVLYFQDLTKKYSLPFLLTCFSKYSHYLRVIISKSDFQNKTKQNKPPFKQLFWLSNTLSQKRISLFLKSPPLQLWVGIEVL